MVSTRPFIARLATGLVGNLRLARVLMLGALAVTLTACGGGGGSDGGGGGGGGGNTAPTASFAANPGTGRVPFTVAFDGSASRDSDGTIATYAWNFGDGTPAGTGATVNHQYTTAGTFTATLTVTDNGGATGSTTRTITAAPPLGILVVTVKDPNGFVVPAAQVTVDVGGNTKSGNTDDAGQVTLTDVVSGAGNLTVSRDTFVTKTQPVTVAPNATTNVEVVLARLTRAIGGVLTTRVTATPDPQTVEFTVTVVVVDEQSNAITGLPDTAFKLEACDPDPATDSADCLAGLAQGQSGLDRAYTPDPASGQPRAFTPKPAGPAQSYAATLLFDQSDSIRDTDPTDARLFSAREFLAGLGAEDRAGLAAFASDGSGGLIAKIPEKPVSIYPIGSPVFVADGAAFFPTLDQLATLEGGRTPLYDAICRVIDFTDTNAPDGGRRQAVVAFTDGRNDTNDSPTDVCRTIDQTVNRSQTKAVDIFTIGLSGDVDGEALATLADGGNGVFLFAEDTAQLITIYGSLGNLLSGTLATYELTFRVSSAAPGPFQAGRGVLGKVTVNTGATTLTLPFVARIF